MVQNSFQAGLKPPPPCVERGKDPRSGSYSKGTVSGAGRPLLHVTRHTFHGHMYKQPVMRCGPTRTHRLSACCGLKTGKRAQDSSTAPRQTGTYTLRCQSECPRPHWWCRSGRPVPGERAVRFPGYRSCRVGEKAALNKIASSKKLSWGLGLLLSA